MLDKKTQSTQKAPLHYTLKCPKYMSLIRDSKYKKLTGSSGIQ